MTINFDGAHFQCLGYSTVIYEDNISNFYDPDVDSFSSLDKGGGLPLDQPLQNIELAIGEVLS